MIKANELRINNVINYATYDMSNGNNILVPVVADGNIIKAIELSPDLNAYHPIPLSPEILEKCGGEKDDKSVFGGYLFRLNGGEQIRIVYSDTIGWHWPMFGHTAVIVNFLHQFQNLIFLVDGNELDVKL